MRTVFFAFIACSWMVACDSSRGADGDVASSALDHAPVQAEQLTGQVLYQGDKLERPTAVALIGPNLVVLDRYADSMIHVIRSGDGEFLGSIGRRGEGPGEFRSARSIDPVPGSDSRFWVYDFSLRRLTHVDLAQDLADPDRLIKERMISLISDVTVLGPVWTDSSTIMALGLFGGGRFGIFGDGRLLRTVGLLPPGNEDVPVQVVQHAYQSSMAPNPDRSLLAVATRHADRLDIYRPDGTVVRHAERPFGFEPKFVVQESYGQAVMATGDDLRFGFIAVATTNDLIFTIFSGRTREDYPGRANFGEYVYVYDWNGHLRRIFQLDSDAIAITVDPAAKTFFTVRRDPTPAIIRYTLPDP